MPALSPAPGRQEPRQQPRSRRSRVTNGKSLFVVGKGTSAYARRLSDVLSAIVSDLGGPTELSEAERQLARRAASLSVACERLEGVICGVTPDEEAFAEQAGGLSPREILTEAGRILHGIARTRGNGGLTQLEALPDAELDRITDLLVKAGDLAAKAIAAGSEKSADLELLGQLSDRCGRAFLRIGLRRRPREVESLQSYLERRAREAPEAVAVEAVDVADGYQEATGEDTRASGLASPPHAYPGDEGAGA
jgi:hypothetical protein